MSLHSGRNNTIRLKPAGSELARSQFATSAFGHEQSSEFRSACLYSAIFLLPQPMKNVMQTPLPQCVEMGLAVTMLAACLLVGRPVGATELAQPAKMLLAPAPEYPAAARRREQEGTVHVRIRVLASGQPSEVHVQRSSGIVELDRSAVSAAEGSSFRPALSATADPMDSWVLVPYKFILQD
jgi:TonB family protein